MLPFIIILLNIYILPCILIAQTARIDSLKRELSRNVPDTNKVDILNALVAELYSRAPEQSLQYAREALTRSEQSGHKKSLARSYQSMGTVLYSRADYAKALLWYERAIPIMNEIQDKKGLAGVYNNIGNVHRNEARYEKALEAYLQSLRLYETIGNKQGLSQIYNNLGNVYERQHNYTQSVDYFLRSFALAEELHDNNGKLRALNNIGVSYQSRNLLDTALTYFLRARAIAEQISNTLVLAIVMGNTGDVYREQRNFPAALAEYQQSLVFHQKLSNPSGIVYILQAMAQTFGKQGRLDEAEKTAKKALSLAEEQRNTEWIRDSYETLSIIADSAGQYKQSLGYYKLYKQWNDSVFTAYSAEKLAAEQTRYESEKKDREIEHLTSEAKYQRNILYSLIAGIAMSLVSFGLALNRYYTKKRSEFQIQKQQHILEEQAQEIELTNTQLQLVNADLQDSNHQLQEANLFKTRILSVAAHDLKNPLSSIYYTASLLQSYHNKLTPQQQQEKLQSILTVSNRMVRLIGDILDSAAAETGSISLSCQQVILSELLELIVQEHLPQMEKKHQRCKRELNTQNTIVYADYHRLWQVFENLLSNAIKYSPPETTIIVRCLHQNLIVRIEIEDEGPGITQEDRAKMFRFFQRLSAQTTAGENSTGIGLAIVKKIVELHDGRVWVESDPESGLTGSRFIVELPANIQNADIQNAEKNL